MTRAARRPAATARNQDQGTPAAADEGGPAGDRLRPHRLRWVQGGSIPRGEHRPVARGRGEAPVGFHRVHPTDRGEPLGGGPVVGTGHHQAAGNTGEVGQREMKKSGWEWNNDRSDRAAAQTPKDPQELARRIIEHEGAANGR